MAVELITESGDPFKLFVGCYSGSSIVEKCARHIKIVKVILAPLASISIANCGNYSREDKQDCFSLVNNSYCALEQCVKLKIYKDSKIAITTLNEPQSDDCGDKCDEEWDIIIAGLGSAGSILARKASDAGKRVLVIEPGINHQDDPIILDPNWPAHFADLVGNPKYAVTYPVGVTPFLFTTYSEGTGGGGSSAHNFLVAFFLTLLDLISWAAASGNPAWLPANVQPLAKQLEHYYPTGTSGVDRGVNGPISITQENPLDQTNPIIANMSAEFNAPFIDDYNVPSGLIGTAAYQNLYTPPPPRSPVSRRSWSNFEFLRVGEIVDEQGNGLHGRKLKILYNAKVTTFNVNKHNRVKSVNYVRTEGDIEKACTAKLAKGGKTKSASLSGKKDGELIICSGTINSPRILLSSGVGPRAQLEAAGVKVIVDSPHVGQNLQNQYGTRSIITGSAQRFLLMTDMSPEIPPTGDRVVELLTGPGPGVFTVLPSILHPRVRGSVTIVTNNPLTQPLVTYVAFSDDPTGTVVGSDLYIQIAIFKKVATAALAAGKLLVFPPQSSFPAPIGPAPNNDLLIQAARDLNQLVLQSHMAGTCRMGQTINDGVVDGELRVFGLKGVRVCDCSIQPRIASGNTCVSSYEAALVLCVLMGFPIPPIL